MSYADIGEVFVQLSVMIGIWYLCHLLRVADWRHRWKYKHDRIYRENHDYYYGS